MEVHSRTPSITHEVHSTSRYVLILLILFVGEFIAIFDISVANVLLPTIQRELFASESAGSLVIAAYSAAYASAVLISGRLGDTYGFARVFQYGIAIFGASSLICALAPSLAVLVAGRALQGLGAALLFPQVLAGIQTAVPPRWRAAGAGIFGAVLGIGSTLGQIGGAWLGLVDFLSSGWRFAFFVNVPVCLAVLVASAFTLHNPRPRRRTLDITGVIYSGIGIGCLVVGLTLINTDITAWTWIPLLAVASVALALFTIQQRSRQRYEDGALISREVLRSSVFVRGLALALAFYLTQVPFYVVLTQAAQTGGGLTPIQSANLYAALGVGFLLSSVATGRLSERHTPCAAAVAAFFLVISFALLIFVPVDQLRPTNAVAVSILALNGVAGGCIAPAVVRLTLSDTRREYAGSASGMLSMGQQLANAIGTTVVVAIFAAGTTSSGAVTKGFATDLVLFAISSVIVLSLTGAFLRRPPVPRAMSTTQT